QLERSGDGAGDLRNFERVRQPIAKMVGIARRENLRLGFQPAKSARVDDAVAVPRIDTTIRMEGFRVAAAAGLLSTHRPGCKSGDWFDSPLPHILADPRE